MTFQPPPPPPGDNPPPPPPAQWGPPPGGGYPAPQSGFDPKTVNPLDWGILGAGLLAFIFSFISYYTVSLGGFSDSASAWHGFFGWFGTLLAMAGAIVVALELFAPQVKMPWPNRLVGLVLFALATLSTIIALFTNAYNTDGAGALGVNVDSGHGFGYWASLVVIIAGLVLSLMRLQQTGGKLPGALGNLPNIGGHGPQGGIGGPGTPPAGPGYGPPPGS
jgi:hypothetical protein